MAASPRQELHELVDRLSDEDAAALLVDARRLAGRRGRGHELPTLHTAPPIASIDELRGEIFPSEERVEEFDATIRRWREEGSVRHARS